ncbi:MAG: uroporphyrinogen decarboxylase family protein [Candidatus Sumerlaeaceae bacterium]
MIKLDYHRTPNFERLRKVLFCQGEPDMVPFIELGIHPMFKSKLLGRPCTTVADEVEFAKIAGYDYIKLQPIIDMNPGRIFPEGGPKTFQVKEGAGERRWADEHSGVIANWAEFERYVWPKPEDVDYRRFEEAEELLPAEMGVIGQYGDIFTLVWELMGFENFAIALYEDPTLVAALFEKVGAIVYDLFKNMATFECVKALWFTDDIAYAGGLIIAPESYRQFLFPWMKRIGDLCKKRGIPYLYHSDGLLYDVFDELLALGINALHPIEPKSMDIVVVKQRGHGKLAVLGHIEVDTLARGTPEEVEQLVRDAIRRAAPGGGYAIGSSNSLPEYCKWENYVTMLQAAHRWGQYPISV